MAELRTKGSSFAAIAQELGCGRGTVREAMFLPLDKQERAIAEKLGVTQRQLFPERFDTRTGRRLHPVNNSGTAGSGNVKESRVA